MIKFCLNTKPLELTAQNSNKYIQSKKGVAVDPLKQN